MPRKLRKSERLAMVAEPQSRVSESFRMLRTNLEFASLDRNVRTILVTSAVEQEGKSTTVANLAVALARAGQRVVLVDLDLRRPFIHRFFDLDGAWGVTQVVLGHVTLDEALTPIALDGRAPLPQQWSEVTTNGQRNGRADGSLVVLPAGPIPPDPGEFVGKRALDGVLAQLRAAADVILVDSPPLLRVGDAMALSAKLDGVLLVSRIDTARRPMLEEVRRVLATAPIERLGVVVTGADARDGYGYGYGYGGVVYGERTEASRREQQVV
jgi:non-specific protein-tyrosine kinase